MLKTFLSFFSPLFWRVTRGLGQFRLWQCFPSWTLEEMYFLPKKLLNSRLKLGFEKCNILLHSFSRSMHKILFFQYLACKTSLHPFSDWTFLLLRIHQRKWIGIVPIQFNNIMSNFNVKSQKSTIKIKMSKI